MCDLLVKYVGDEEYGQIIDQLSIKLKNQGVNTRFYNYKGVPQASTDELTNVISVLINDPFIRFVLSGVSSGIIYDSIKVFLLNSIKFFRGKVGHVVRADGVSKEAISIGIEFKGANRESLNLRLDNISENSQEVAIEKAFDLFESIAKKELELNTPDYYIGDFDQKKGQWNLISYRDKIEREKKEKS